MEVGEAVLKNGGIAQILQNHLHTLDTTPFMLSEVQRYTFSTWAEVWEARRLFNNINFSENKFFVSEMEFNYGAYPVNKRARVEEEKA
jgi:hypothetical protein